MVLIFQWIVVMNPKMNKFLAVMQPLTAGMNVELNGDEYYMSDSVLYRKDMDNRGCYVHMSLNKFINMCGLLENNEVKTITTDFIKWGEKYDGLSD